MSIEAMKQALEALDGLSEPYDVLKAQNALRTAIEQAEKQEPLYTAPPKREWVGLTKEEIKEISFANRPYVVDMVVALEAKLKEKNT